MSSITEEVPILPLRALRRPLRATERSAIWGDRRDLAKETERTLRAVADEYGERTAEEAAREVIRVLMLGAMTARLLDAKRGTIPKAVGRMEKATRSFERPLR